MNSDCRMEQNDSCDTSFTSTDSNCSAYISFEDIQTLTSRLASHLRTCANDMINSGILPTLELDHCFRGWGDDCEPAPEQPQETAHPELGEYIPDDPLPLTPPDRPEPTPELSPELSPPPEWQEGPAIEGGARVEIGDGAIPEILQRYASYENGMLVIDAKGDELPPLSITRDNVIIRAARIRGFDGPTIGIYGANNVVVEGSEIAGGQRGILADHSSNVTVKNNWLHDFRWAENYDTSAIEFDHVSGGSIESNRISGLYRSDAVSMFESQDLRTTNNNLDITIDEWSSAPLMVEGNTSSGIEVSNNTINYREGNNVPPGILGGSNHRAFNNVVNGDRSVGAWQMYAYNDVWQQIYFDGQRISPT